MLLSKPTTRVYKININEEIYKDALVFDFNHSLDRNYWNIEERGENYNEELQYYHPNNIKVENGFLKIEARKENYNNHEYTSGLINTKGKFEFIYGKIIIRAKPAEGIGLLSAVWLLPANGYFYPEIDFIEALGTKNKTWTGIHYLDTELKKQKNFVSFPTNNDFSIYELHWEENQIKVYVDNELKYKINKNVPAEEMYLIINLAVGGVWPGEPDIEALPANFLIDYIIVMPNIVSK